MNRLKLSLKKEVIQQLDKVELAQLNGGDDFTTLWGSNCNNSNPAQHECCGGSLTMPECCVSYTTVTGTTPGTCCSC